jgi:hypothetical protein
LPELTVGIFTRNGHASQLQLDKDNLRFFHSSKPIALALIDDIFPVLVVGDLCSTITASDYLDLLPVPTPGKS